MRRIVFFCEGQLGDLLILTPAVRAVRQSFPDVHITTIILQRRKYDQSVSSKSIWHTAGLGGTSGVMLGNQNVDRVIEIDRSLLRRRHGIARLLTEIKIIRQLRELAPDACVCTFPQDRFAIWGFLSGAHIRVGQARQKFAWLLTHKPDLSRADLGVRDYYLGLVASIGAETGNRITEFIISSEAHAWASERIKGFSLTGEAKLVAIHPGASGPYKVWPPEFFAELIDRLQNGSGWQVVLCGTEFDREIITAIKRHLNSPVYEITFDEDVSRFAAILFRCRLSITNDSGPRHLSVAVGTPSLAFMMKDQEREWKIYEDPAKSLVLQVKGECSVCHSGPCKHLIPEGHLYGAYCLRSIAVEDVLAQIEKL